MNRFAADAARPQTRRRARHFLGGLMHCIPELMPLYAPYVNSYKRLRARGLLAVRQRLGLRQPLGRLPHGRRRRRRAHREPRARRRREPVSRLRGDDRLGPVRHRARARAGAVRRRQRAHDARRRAPAAYAGRGAGALPRLRAGGRDPHPRRGAVLHDVHRARARGLRERGHRLGARRAATNRRDRPDA